MLIAGTGAKPIDVPAMGIQLAPLGAASATMHARGQTQDQIERSQAKIVLLANDYQYDRLRQHEHEDARHHVNL